MNKSFYEHCIETNQRVLIEQWLSEKNGDLTAQNVSAFSNRKVWWRCEKGHEWQTEVKVRAMGTGCPICLNREVCSGFNDLATVLPEVAAQWHPTKNGALTPDKVVPGKHRKVWWQCELGHEWEAQVSCRSGGTGCPVCAGKKAVPGFNDLATFYPDIAQQWHPTRNGNLTPQNVTSSCNKKVWWQCELGHEYEAHIFNIKSANTNGCPYCSGKRVLAGFNDLATTHPTLAKEWHSTLNGDLTPEMVSRGSNKKVWWQCSEGHVWQACIYSRSRASGRKSGCPVCAGNISRKRRDRYAAMMENK